MTDASWQEQVHTREIGKRDIVHPADDRVFHSGEAKPVAFADADAKMRFEEGFVRLVLSASDGSLTAELLKLQPEDVPLNRDLEPGSVRRVPRQPSDTLQIIHRQRTGTRLRYDLDERQFQPVVNTRNQADQVHWPTKEKLQVMLRPAVNDGRRIVLLEESAWLYEPKKQNGTSEPLMTESLVVIFRPQSVSAFSGDNESTPKFVTVLENRTVPESDESDAATARSDAEEESHFKEQIRRAGAAGVALVRRLDAAGNVRFHFINSPFFARAAEDTQDDELEVAAVSESFFERDSVRAVAEMPAVAGQLDLRVLRPLDVIRWATVAAFHWYRPGDRSDDPLRMRPCVPHRELRWQRQLVDASGQEVPYTDFGDSRPSIRSLEATAFREMGKLFHLPAAGRRPSDNERQKLFLPGTIDTRLAPDKPGATFHQLLQVQTFYPEHRTDEHEKPLPPWDLEPMVDFVLREPQQIKVTGCVTARVDLKEVQVEKLKSNEQLAELRVTWDEIIGSTPVNESLADPSDDDPDTKSPEWLRISQANGLELVKPPVQLVVQFNDKILDILPNEPAVPAYMVERRDPKTGKK